MNRLCLLFLLLSRAALAEEFPDLSTTEARELLSAADRIVLYEGERKRELKPRKELVERLVASEFVFVPADVFIPPDATVLGLEARAGGRVYHWYWPASHPARAAKAFFAAIRAELGGKKR